MVRCFVPDCNHHNDRGRICRFFYFPKDKKLKKLWIRNIRRADKWPSKCSSVCSCHFKDGLKAYGPTIFSHTVHKHGVPKDPTNGKLQFVGFHPERRPDLFGRPISLASRFSFEDKEIARADTEPDETRHKLAVVHTRKLSLKAFKPKTNFSHNKKPLTNSLEETIINSDEPFLSSSRDQHVEENASTDELDLGMVRNALNGEVDSPVEENMSNIEPDSPIEENVSNIEPDAPVEENVSNIEPDSPIEDNVSNIEPDTPIEEKTRRRNKRKCRSNTDELDLQFEKHFSSEELSNRSPLYSDESSSSSWKPSHDEHLSSDDSRCDEPETISSPDDSSCDESETISSSDDSYCEELAAISSSDDTAPIFEFKNKNLPNIIQKEGYSITKHLNENDAAHNYYLECMANLNPKDLEDANGLVSSSFRWELAKFKDTLNMRSEKARRQKRTLRQQLLNLRSTISYWKQKNAVLKSKIDKQEEESS